MTEQQLAAMRQALEALIAASGHVNNEVFVKVMMARDALNDALRTAIEQAETAPVQEPVATFDIAVNERTAAINYDYRKHKLVSGTPLYTTPPAAPTGQAPCARHCEATAFQIVIKNLKGDIERLKAAQPAIPGGWKLVPVEPTEEMWLAGVRAGTEHMNAPPHIAYKAMLAAAPQKGGAA